MTSQRSVATGQSHVTWIRDDRDVKSVDAAVRGAVTGWRRYWAPKRVHSAVNLFWTMSVRL